MYKRQQRGYVSFGKEHAKGRKEGDLKEFWHFGQYVDKDSKYASEYPDNVDVKELPQFNVVGKEAYQMQQKKNVKEKKEFDIQKNIK